MNLFENNIENLINFVLLIINDLFSLVIYSVRSCLSLLLELLLLEFLIEVMMSRMKSTMSRNCFLNNLVTVTNYLQIILQREYMDYNIFAIIECKKEEII